MSKYAVFQEINGKACETWLTFIKYEGNEDELNELQKQLQEVEWYILGELSLFDMDLIHLVSEETARDICKLNLKNLLRHRKFDGKLSPVSLGFHSSANNTSKIVKAFKTLSYGRIEKYLTGEDIVISENERTGKSPLQSPRLSSGTITPTDNSKSDVEFTGGDDVTVRVDNCTGKNSRRSRGRSNYESRIDRLGSRGGRNA